MKQRIRVVVVENEKLHSDLKSKQAVDESLRDYTMRSTMVMFICVFKSVLELCSHEIRIKVG